MKPRGDIRKAIAARWQNRTMQERFEEKIFYSPDGCWYWIAAMHPSGYGQFFKIGSKWPLAHRVAYEIYKGPIDDMCVCHTCDNILCVNPDHLFLGTHQDNMNDKKMKGRANSLKGTDSSLSKLTNPDVILIRGLRNKMSAPKVANMFGVGSTAIYSIWHRQTWKHI